LAQEFPIEVLSAADISENVTLARSVGWHDSEGDWRVMHAGAFVLGARHTGRLIAQGALGRFGRVGTIAKMIVANDFQRQGLGSRILQALLAEALRAGIEQLGLVATPFGRPVYERAGFVTVGDVVVLTGIPRVAEGSTHATQLSSAGSASALERRFFACDRSTVIDARFHEAIASAAVSEPNAGTQAYALATAQEAHAPIGPVIAENETQAHAVVSSIFGKLGRAVRIDVPAEHVSFRAWLRSIGLEEQTVRAEMSSDGRRLPWQVPERFALIAQAWG
jgi:GNAT superfamily N-acetyltransferase